MRLYHWLFISTLFHTLSTCAPITIHYTIISSNMSLRNDTVFLNSGHQQLVCNIEQSHYPNQKVKNIINITLENFSKDTLFPDSQFWLKIITQTDLADTSYLDSLITQNNKVNVLPNDQVNFSCNYWSRNFKGSFKELITALKREEVKLIIRYRINRTLYVDSIRVKPDLKRFEKRAYDWKVFPFT